MSKPRFKMILHVDTLAHARTIRDAIIAELSGKDIFEQHSLDAYQDEDGSIVGVAEWRFNNNPDRDAIKDWIRDQVENHPQVKTWVLSARLSWHRCTHEEGVISNCRETDYSEWVR